MRISQAIGMWMVGILKFPPVKSLRKISTARFETTEMICVAPWWKKGLCILYSSPFLASRKAAAWPIPCGHFWFIKVIGGDINWNDHFYWGQCFYDQKKGISIHVQSVSLKQKKTSRCPTKIPITFEWLRFQGRCYLVGGIPTFLKNDGVCQLDWWNSQYMEK